MSGEHAPVRLTPDMVRQFVLAELAQNGERVHDPLEFAKRVAARCEVLAGEKEGGHP